MSEAPKLRGFARLPPEERKRVAASGGRSVDPKKRTFATNPELAVEAGRKGGETSRKPKKTA